MCVLCAIELQAVIEKKIDCIKTMIEVLKLQEKCTV